MPTPYDLLTATQGLPDYLRPVGGTFAQPAGALTGALPSGLQSMQPQGMPAAGVPGMMPAGGMPGGIPGMPQVPGMGVQQPNNTQRSASPASGGLRPEDVELFMSMQQMKPKQQVIERQRKMADMLRSNGTSGLQGVQAGRFYKAPTALNLLADVYSKYAAHQQDQAADEAAKGLATQEQTAGKTWFNNLFNKGQ